MFWCRQCDCEVAKQTKEQIDVGATFDEGISPQDLMGPPISARVLISGRGSKTGAVEAVNEIKEQQAPGEDRPPTPSTADGSRSQRSETSMGEETRRVEKERLHSMVKSFSREAVSGLECKMVRNSGRTSLDTASTRVPVEYAACKFSLDTALTRMTLDDGTKKLMVSFMDIVEVCASEDLTEQAPDSQMFPELTGVDRRRAVFVQHRACDFPESWLCLVVEDEADAERYVACLKILQMYSQAKGGPAPSKA